MTDRRPSPCWGGELGLQGPFAFAFGCFDTQNRTEQGAIHVRQRAAKTNQSFRRRRSHHAQHTTHTDIHSHPSATTMFRHTLLLALVAAAGVASGEWAHQSPGNEKPGPHAWLARSLRHSLRCSLFVHSPLYPAQKTNTFSVCAGSWAAQAADLYTCNGATPLVGIDVSAWLPPLHRPAYID